MSEETSPMERNELIAALNELLEAERAGARVARETAAEIEKDIPLRGLVTEIQHDEVRWCAMLMRLIKSLEVVPSDQTGAFHGKAMAIGPIHDRLVFLNRGQAWVVRRLQNLIPRLSDAGMRAELQTMLDAHVGNIRRVEEQLSV